MSVTVPRLLRFPLPWMLKKPEKSAIFYLTTWGGFYGSDAVMGLSPAGRPVDEDTGSPSATMRGRIYGKSFRSGACGGNTQEKGLVGEGDRRRRRRGSPAARGDKYIRKTCSWQTFPNTKEPSPVFNRRRRRRGSPAARGDKYIRKTCSWQTFPNAKEPSPVFIAVSRRKASDPAKAAAADLSNTCGGTH